MAGAFRLYGQQERRRALEECYQIAEQHLDYNGHNGAYFAAKDIHKLIEQDEKK